MLNTLTVYLSLVRHLDGRRNFGMKCKTAKIDSAKEICKKAFLIDYFNSYWMKALAESGDTVLKHV